ncbi:SDR family NAD(P)-dependent oxidoreductase [Pseudonocardia broussonetiae]|uniref:SDR family NAD(P)-dependent oxidoreductase n=1 Tax=Pseudonocardia broussonetiae TaxID=2736640 RepID=A0A6M6JDP0_9PSEU|nr:SDR family NAD(P)-dependent oxidoreductase [Pseudonocardia broussonetiae]QJY46064.1 SDR family NAD(P)-dependent oxidoreductase [Pseudonocardia broussonetiae]
MKLGMDTGRLVALDEETDTWVVVGEPWNHDLLAFLADGEDAVGRAREAMARAGRVTADPPAGLPFAPASLRAFALWESHMVNGARGMVSTFAPPALRNLAAGFEKVTGKPFPALKPKPNYYRDPQFYMGNHRSVLADRATVTWPSFADVLDFELELGAVIARPVNDCTPAEGLAAIGGFVVMNDWSARDTQWDDTRAGTFGGVVKAKTFAGAMSAVVVTADEIVPRWTRLTGRVLVNGEKWAESTTAGPLHDLGAAVVYAARGESLGAGDVLSSGTLPGCCGLEMRRFPSPGDEVRLEIDGLATLTNVIGPRTHAPDVSRTVTVVTGCDSGIGKALALEFHRRGRTVYATGLRQEAMSDLAATGLRVAELDVTDTASIAALVERLAEDDVRVDLLVNNAGFGAMGPVIEMPMDAVRRQYEVNVFGLLATTQELARGMIDARSGTIVNVGSTSGVLTSPFAGVYCSTKSAVHSLTDAMRMELAPFGISVIRVEPNQIRTNFGDTAATAMTARIAEDSRYLPVQDAMTARAQGSQKEGSMPAPEFAAKVADGVLATSPALRLRVGRELWPYTIFKPFLPSHRIDRILSKRYDLDRLA